MKKHQDQDFIDLTVEDPPRSYQNMKPLNGNSAEDQRLVTQETKTPDSYDDTEHYFTLPEDTYGLLLLLDVKSILFWKAFLVTIFQIALIILISMDLLVDGINPPAGVNTAVLSAQIMALLIGVVSQNDIASAAELLVYKRKNLAKYLGKSPFHVLIINLLHFLVGVGSLFIVFVIVVQSEEIVDLFANFAAMEFIANIDELFFTLANLSYFGNDLYEKTEQVKDTKIPKTKQKLFIKRLFLVTPGVIVFALWIRVKYQEHRGKFVTPVYTVSIPDEYDKYDSYFSGRYSLLKNCKRKNERFLYGQDKIVKYKNGTDEKFEFRRGVIAYCERSSSWVMNSYTPINPNLPIGSCAEINNKEIYDTCERVHLQSPSTKKYDFVGISPPEWKMKTSNGRFVPAPRLFDYISNRCNVDKDCGLLDDGSRNGGTCDTETHTCICKDGRFGESCEHPRPCEVLHVVYFDVETLQYERENNKKNTAALVRTMEGKPFFVNYRPIYSQIYENGEQFIFIYQGVRYIQYRYPFEGSNTAFTNEQIVSRFKNKTDILTPLFFSKQTDIGSPEGLDWYEVVSTSLHNEIGGGFGTFGPKKDWKVICPVCDNINTCGDDGTCVNKSCKCNKEWSGSRCQINDPPILTLSPTFYTSSPGANKTQTQNKNGTV